MPTPDGSRPRLGFVSRLSERKAQHVAIAAVDVLRGRGRTVELELAGTVYPGNEAYEARLRREVAVRDLGDLVSSAATSPRRPPCSTEATSPCPCRPATRSATSSSRPSSPSDRSSPPGVGGHLESIVDGVTGLHVAPGDADAVADAVESLLADPVRAREMALAGRESARTLFGVRRYGERVVALVRELAATRSHH